MFQGTALAKRRGKPYPPTFRSPLQWTHRESNPPVCQGDGASMPRWRRPVGPAARFQVDLMGVEPTAPTLQGSVASSGMQAHLSFTKRSVRGSNPASRLTEAVCSRNTYRPSDPGWSRTTLSWTSARRRRRWTTGSLSSRGGHRTHKIARLSTSPLFLFAYPAVSGRSGGRTRRAELMRLH